LPFWADGVHWFAASLFRLALTWFLNLRFSETLPDTADDQDRERHDVRGKRYDAAFKRDRLQEASAKLTERVGALKALEADRRLQVEHVRVLAERDRLAEEMERMAEPIARIAHLVVEIEVVDRKIGRLASHTGIIGSGYAPDSSRSHVTYLACNPARAFPICLALASCAQLRASSRQV
jgi:hypothetical protein